MSIRGLKTLEIGALMLIVSFPVLFHSTHAFMSYPLTMSRQKQAQREFSVCIGSSMAKDLDEEDSQNSDIDSSASISDPDAAAEKEHQIKKQTYVVNLQLKGLASKKNRMSRLKVARKAYDLLRSLKHPDTVSYNSAMNLQVDTDLALNLLAEMEDIHKIQTEKNHQWYWKNSEGELTPEELAEGPPPVRVKPNVRSFSTVIRLFAKQGTVSGAQQCEELLERLRTKFEKTGDYAYEPNTICWNTILDAWAKVGDEEGASKCRRIIHEMGDFADVISLNTVLHAIARSGHPMAGEQAEELLRSSENINPNARSYSTCADAWSRSHGCSESAERAHSLLLEAEKLEKTSGGTKFKLNCIFYATVVNAYTWSKTDPFKAHKAFGILQKTSRRSKTYPDSRPNVVVYNCVLNCIANTSPNRFNEEIQSIDKHLPSLTQLIRMTYTQLLEKETFEPDHRTFGTVLKAIANLFLTEPDYVHFCEEVFKEACDRGVVSHGVLASLRLAAPSELYYSLLPSDAYDIATKKFDMNRIPKEWTQNVKNF